MKTFLPIIGDNVASIISSKFSKTTVLPSSIHSPIILINFLLFILNNVRPLSFSFSFIHFIPCNWGSIIKDHLSEFVKIVAFSIETGSAGNFWLFHFAFSASFVKILRGSIAISLLGIWFASINSKKEALIPSLYFLGKGPQ